MKKLKDFNKMSLLTLSTTAFTFANISQSYAQVVQAQTTHNLNLRSGSNTKDTIILTLQKGTKVEIIKSLGEWSKIKYKNSIGYVSSQYLKKVTVQDNVYNNENSYKPDKVKIMASGVNFLNIRFGPSSSEKILGTIKKGDKVEIIHKINNTWARIKYNGGHGYVNMKYLTTVNSNIISSNSSVMYCITETLNIRKGPSSKDLIIGSFKKNDKVEVAEILTNGWSKIKLNNSFAYVSSQYLSNKFDFMKCKVDLLDIRSGPSSSEKIINQLKKGDIVEVVYHVSTGWTKIKYATGYAYVSTHYLATIS